MTNPVPPVTRSRIVPSSSMAKSSFFSSACLRNRARAPAPVDRQARDRFRRHRLDSAEPLTRRVARVSPSGACACAATTQWPGLQRHASSMWNGYASLPSTGLPAGLTMNPLKPCRERGRRVVRPAAAGIMSRTLPRTGRPRHRPGRAWRAARGGIPSGW